MTRRSHWGEVKGGRGRRQRETPVGFETSTGSGGAEPVV